MAVTAKLQFRAFTKMMKHPSTIAIFSEWQRLAFAMNGNLQAPQRASLSPRRLGRHLSELFLLEIDQPCEPVFRLAGTQICKVFGRELRAKAFLSLWPDQHHMALKEMIGNVNQLLIPTLSHHSAISFAGRRLSFEMMLAPLAASSEKKINMLGSLSILDEVSWVGSDPLLLADLQTIMPLSPDLTIRPNKPIPPALRVNARSQTAPNKTILGRSEKPRLKLISGGKI